MITVKIIALIICIVAVFLICTTIDKGFKEYDIPSIVHLQFGIKIAFLMILSSSITLLVSTM